MRRTFLIAVFFSVALAACAGTKSMLPGLTPIGTSQNTGAPSATLLSVRLIFPSAAPSLSRRPAFVSPSTQSVALTVTGPSAGTAPAPQIFPCTPAACTMTASAIPGVDTLSFALYDQPNAKGTLLGTAATTATIIAGTTNTVAVSIDGVPAKLAITAAQTYFYDGLAQNIPLSVQAYDADGNLIAGTAPYATPINLSFSDSSGTTSLSSTQVTAPGQGVTLRYSGQTSFQSVTVSASMPSLTTQSITISRQQPQIGTVMLDSLGPRNLLLERPASGATPIPENVGSGKSNGIVQDPNNPSTLYNLYGRGHGFFASEITNGGGIYKSMDGGKTYTPIDNGLQDGYVDDLWVDPNNSSILVAGTWVTGIYRSTDAGASWALVDATQAEQFAYLNGKLFCACFTDGVLESDDNGQTWQNDVSFGGGGIDSIATSKSYVFAAADNDGSLLYEYSNGAWSQIYTFPTGVYVSALAASPLNDSNITVLNSNQDGNLLYYSTNGGMNFSAEPIPTILYNTWGDGPLSVQSLAYSSVFPSRLYTLGSAPLYYTDDNGTDWNASFNLAIYGSVGDGRDIRLQPNGSGGDACYISSDQGSMFAQDCSNLVNVASWQIFQGVSSNVTYDLAVSQSTIFVNMQDYVGTISTDGGNTWNPNTYTEEGGMVAIDPYDQNICITSAGYNGLATTSDTCNSLVQKPGAPAPVGPGIYANNFTRDWITFSNDGNTIWTVGGSPGQFYVSTNKGTSWSQLANPPDTLNTPWLIDVDPTNPAHLIAGTNGFTSGTDYDYVYVSVNGGQSWTQTLSVPSAASRLQLNRMTMDFDPVNTQIAVLAQMGPGSVLNLYRSTDGGKTWTTVNFSPASSVGTLLAKRVVDLSQQQTRKPGRARTIDYDQSEDAHRDTAMPQPSPFLEPAYAYAVNRLRFNPQSTAPILAMATTAGLYLSPDAGQTWVQADNNSNTISHYFWNVVWQNGYLYTTGIGQGVMRSDIPLQPVVTPSPISTP
jgi:hypothetical protein